MAFYQRATKLALMPAGAAAASASTSLLLGRCYTSTTNQKLHQVASKKLNTTIGKKSFAAFPRAGYRRRFTSAVPKEAIGKSSAGIKTTIAKKGGKGFVEWYEGHLNSRPVTTKAVTGSILWGVGDLVAQVMPILFAEQSNEENNDNEKPKNEFAYDYPRTARAVTFGFALHAPLSHLHFNFLEWMTVRAGLTGLAIPVFKTIMEQFVYWSWISNCLYHGALGAMQGMKPNQIYDRISDVLWDTQVAQWTFWIPVQLLNFQFVPVRHQLNVVLLTSVVWTALLSAWYPPEENKEEEKNNSTTEEL